MRINKVYFLVFFGLVLLIILAFSKILFTPGAIIYGDFLYPVTADIDRIFFPFFTMWGEVPSASNLLTLNRLLFSLPLLLLGWIFKLDPPILYKIWLVSTFVLAAFSMLVFSVYIFRRFKPNLSPHLLAIAGFLSALIYTLNPWTLDRIVHFYLLVPYALLPLILYFFAKALETKKVLPLILTSFIWATVTTSQILPIIIGLVLTVWLIWELFYDFKVNKIRIYFLVLLWFVIFNLYWLLPLLITVLNQSDLMPYILTQESVEMLARRSTLLNTSRLIGAWSPPVNYQPFPLAPTGILANRIWTLASFILPLTALASILLTFKKRVTKFFLILLVIALLLATGPSGPLGKFYIFLVLGPGGWILRESDKLTGLLSFCYAILFGLLVIKLLSSKNQQKNSSKHPNG